MSFDWLGMGQPGCMRRELWREDGTDYGFMVVCYLERAKAVARRAVLDASDMRWDTEMGENTKNGQGEIYWARWRMEAG